MPAAATKVVLLNGPPGCGKDMAARLLVQSLNNACQKEMKTALHACIMQHYGLAEDTWFQLCQRANKEVPQVCLGGLSPRQAQIYVSEQLIKAQYGPDYFVQRTLANFEPGKINIVSDSGFPIETQVLCPALGANNVLIVRLSREGTSFAGDSRCYIYDPRCPSIDITNNGSEEELCLVLLAAVLNHMRIQ